MGLSFWHILIVVLVALVLFGRQGKISEFMGDLGKGIRSFKAGLNDEKVADKSETPKLPPSDTHV